MKIYEFCMCHSLSEHVTITFPWIFTIFNRFRRNLFFSTFFGRLGFSTSTLWTTFFLFSCSSIWVSSPKTSFFYFYYMELPFSLIYWTYTRLIHFDQNRFETRKGLTSSIQPNPLLQLDIFSMLNKFSNLGIPITKLWMVFFFYSSSSMVWEFFLFFNLSTTIFASIKDIFNFQAQLWRLPCLSTHLHGTCT